MQPNEDSDPAFFRIRNRLPLPARNEVLSKIHYRMVGGGAKWAQKQLKHMSVLKSLTVQLYFLFTHTHRLTSTPLLAVARLKLSYMTLNGKTFKVIQTNLV